MTPRAQVRIGIVGAGLMGREIAAAIRRWPALIDHPVTPVITGVCDINPAAMDWFDQLGTVTVKTTDYRTLLASDEIDVVYIAVRHDLHEEMYIAAINAGKDLLAEKPFGIDLPAAERITRVAHDNTEVFVRVSSEMPFFPGAQAAINYIQSGAIGKIIEASSGFHHSSDLDITKPINWKRQRKFCGNAGVMNDLGLHALHVPLRLGWIPTSLHAVLQDLVSERPGPDGSPTACDTTENAILHAAVEQGDGRFPLTVSMKRISPGDKNTWTLDVVGMDGAIRFSTKNPKQLLTFRTVQLPGSAVEQAWCSTDTGSQSVWPTSTGAIFEFGFADSILQMWAAFLAERAGLLGDRFGCATPEEALATHRIYAAAMRADGDNTVAAVR